MSLKLIAKTNYSCAPTKVASEIVAIASLTAEEQPKDKARNPIDLVVVLDRSGSMAGDKLALCKKTLGFLIEEALSDQDFLSLVSFDTEVRIEYPGAKMTKENKQDLIMKVNALTDGSSTNLSGGLFQGLDLLREKGTADVSAICLLTDGMMNHGVVDRNELVRMTQEKLSEFKRAKPSIFTFGYGTDADSTVLAMIAEATGGNYYRIQNPESVPISFADCLGGLMAVAAQNIQLLCELSGGGAMFAADPYTRFPFEKVGPSSYMIKIKDMYCGEHRDLLFRIRMPISANEQPTSLAFTCKYMDTLNEVPAISTCLASITRYVGDKLPDSPPDQDVMKHLVRVEAAKALEEAKTSGDNGKLEQGRQQLNEVLGLIDNLVEKKAVDATDVMMVEIKKDIESAALNLRSTTVFKTTGKAMMQQSAMSHAYQRSNKVDEMLDADDSVEQSAYANQSKKSMMGMAKAKFGF